MEPISTSDRLMALLRQRLKERAAAGKSGSTVLERKPAAPSGLATLAALRGVDMMQLRRTCIQALLADQLGQGLLNDAQFQQVVTRVTQAISEDITAARLLDRIVNDLRSS